jgi:hypothetical protein
MERLSGSCKAIPNYFSNNLGGSLVGRFCLGADIGRCYIVQKTKQVTLAGKKTARTALEGRRGLRPQFVQSGRFFFGHSCHKLLLRTLVRQPCERTPNFAAFHSMENINGVLINDIVKDFQYSTFGIETEQKVFIFMFGKVNLVLKNPVGKGAANIRLADTVTKCRSAELNISVQHISILPQTGKKYKGKSASVNLACGEEKSSEQ